MPQTTGQITKIEIVPPPGAPVVEPPVGGMATSFQAPAVEPAIGDKADLHDEAAAPKGVFDQVTDFVKQTLGIPFETVASMPEQALHHEDVIAGALQQNQELFDQAYNAFKRGDVSQGTVRGLFYLLNAMPGVGTRLNEAGLDVARGDVGTGMGKGGGLGLTFGLGGLFEHGANVGLDKVDAYRATRATAAGNEAYQTNLRKAVGGVSEHGPTADVNDRVAMRPYLSVAHEHAPITNAETGAHGFANAAKLANAQFEYSAQPFATDLLHTKPLQAAQDAIKAMQGPRTTDMAAAMDELASLGLDQPMSVSQGIGILTRLNAEETRHLSLPGATRANLEMHDPRFVANQAAMRTLRNDIYQHMADKGVPGIRQLRLTHGALIEHRNAAQRLIHSGQNIVEGSEKGHLSMQVAAGAAGGLVSGGIAGALGGPYAGYAAAGAGAPLSAYVAGKILPALTRDEAFRRAFAQLSREQPTVAARPRPGPAPAPSHITVEPPPPAGPTVTVERPRGPRGLPPKPPPPAPPPPRGLPAHEGRPMPPSTMRLESQMQVSPARGVVIRDPRTGQLKRVYTSEAATAATPTEPLPAGATMPLEPLYEESGAPLSSLGTTLEAPNVEPAAPAPPVAAGPGLQNRPVERAAPAPVSRPQPAGGRGGGAPEGSTANIPKGYEGHFQSLVPFARKNGFTGRTDDLAKVYRERIDEAQEINRASEDSPENDDRAHRTLLQAVADAGGIGIEANTGKGSVVGGAMGRAMEGGSKGEVTALLDMLERMPVRGSKPGAARQVKPHMRAEGTVGDIRGVIKRTGGETLDHILESLHEGGRFQHLDSTNDLLDAVREAIFHETQGPGTPSATSPAKIQSTLEYLGVTRDHQWWLPRPPEEFSFDEKTP